MRVPEDSAYSAVCADARAAALTPEQQASLRHAGVSLPLIAGLPVIEVARRTGQSVAVMLKIYARCMVGQADAADKRIT